MNLRNRILALKGRALTADQEFGTILVHRDGTDAAGCDMVEDVFDDHFTVKTFAQFGDRRAFQIWALSAVKYIDFMG